MTKYVIPSTVITIDLLHKIILRFHQYYFLQILFNFKQFRSRLDGSYQLSAGDSCSLTKYPTISESIANLFINNAFSCSFPCNLLMPKLALWCLDNSNNGNKQEKKKKCNQRFARSKTRPRDQGILEEEWRVFIHHKGWVDDCEDKERKRWKCNCSVSILTEYSFVLNCRVLA